MPSESVLLSNDAFVAYPGLSAYILAVLAGTTLGRWHQGSQVDDDDVQFKALKDMLGGRKKKVEQKIFNNMY